MLDVIQLRQVLILEWNNIPQAGIITLTRSMRQHARQSFMLKVVTRGINLGFWSATPSAVLLPFIKPHQLFFRTKSQQNNLLRHINPVQS